MASRGSPQLVLLLPLLLELEEMLNGTLDAKDAITGTGWSCQSYVHRVGEPVVIGHKELVGVPGSEVVVVDLNRVLSSDQQFSYSRQELCG